MSTSFNFNIKHNDLLPELLERVWSGSPTIEEDVLELINRTMQANGEKSMQLPDDATIAHCTPNNVDLFHGDLIGVAKPTDLSADSYKVFVKAVLDCIRSGSTQQAIQDTLHTMFTQVSVVEYFKVSTSPELRKIFSAYVDIDSAIIFDTAAIALKYLHLFLDLVRTVTSYYRIDSIFVDSFGLVTDSRVEFIFTGVAAGPAVITTKSMYPLRGSVASCLIAA